MSILEIVIYILLICGLCIFFHTKGYSKGYKDGADRVLEEWKDFNEKSWEGIGD